MDGWNENKPSLEENTDKINLSVICYILVFYMVTFVFLFKEESM